MYSQAGGKTEAEEVELPFPESTCLDKKACKLSYEPEQLSATLPQPWYVAKMEN